MQDIYRNIKEIQSWKKGKILIAFDHLIADMSNISTYADISIVLITQSFFKVSEEVRLNSTHFFIMKIISKRELKQIALNHSSNIDLKDFIKIYKKCTAEHYCFLVTDTTLPSDNPLRFGKNILK